MANLCLDKPMKISFINKNALKLVGYKPDEASLLTINHLMPKFIAEAHSSFIEEFMLIGKARIIQRRREMFVKNKYGSLIPVYVFLSINSLFKE